MKRTNEFLSSIELSNGSRFNRLTEITEVVDDPKAVGGERLVYSIVGRDNMSYVKNHLGNKVPSLIILKDKNGTMLVPRYQSMNDGEPTVSEYLADLILGMTLLDNGDMLVELDSRTNSNRLLYIDADERKVTKVGCGWTSRGSSKRNKSTNKAVLAFDVRGDGALTTVQVSWFYGIYRELRDGTERRSLHKLECHHVLPVNLFGEILSVRNLKYITKGEHDTVHDVYGRILNQGYLPIDGTYLNRNFCDIIVNNRYSELVDVLEEFNINVIKIGDFDSVKAYGVTEETYNKKLKKYIK